MTTSPRVPAPAAAEPVVWTVRGLIAGIRQQLEAGYPSLWVEGEISNCRPAASGHVYFTLKDRDAQLPVVLFRGQARLLAFKPGDGMAVRVRGRVSVYDSRGQLQLIAETMQEQGTGALLRAFERLRAQLRAEGLFDRVKQPLPAHPRSIGIITSTSGAALRDIISVVRRRHARLNLLIYPAAMQGANCPATVAAGVRWFNRHPERVDLILIARGGGSVEDLAGFNDEALARVIAASRLPVLSAIGHQTDSPISDEAADHRAPTPSAAAEIITAAQHRIEDRVQALTTRVERASRFHLLHLRQRLSRLSAESVLDRIRFGLARREQRLDDLRQRLELASERRQRALTRRLDAVTGRLERQAPAHRLALSHRRLTNSTQCLHRAAGQIVASRRGRLAHSAARLDALSPLAVLTRGYAIVYSAEGRILRSAQEAQPGQTIRARLADGSLSAVVLPPSFTSKDHT